MNSTEDEDLPPRSILTLQKWLHRRAELLREVETFSNSALQEANRSPTWTKHLVTEPAVDKESNSDSDSEPEPDDYSLHSDRT